MNVKVEGLNLDQKNNTISIVLGRTEYAKMKLEKLTAARDQFIDEIETRVLELMELKDRVKATFDPRIKSLQDQLNEFKFVLKVIEGINDDDKEDFEEELIKLTANDRKHLRLLGEIIDNVTNEFVRTVNGKTPEKKPEPPKPVGVTNGLIRKPNGMTVIRTIVKDNDIPDKIDVMPERTPMMQFKPEDYLTIDEQKNGDVKFCAKNKFIASLIIKFIEDRGGQAQAEEIRQWISLCFPEIHKAWDSVAKGLQNIQQIYLKKESRLKIEKGTYTLVG